jgi:hypothetical protein
MWWNECLWRCNKNFDENWTICEIILINMWKET